MAVSFADIVIVPDIVVDNGNEMRMTKKKQNIHFFVYSLGFMLTGFLMASPGAIYLELEKDLNVSSSMISIIFSCMSIGYIVSNIACGYISDRIRNVHAIQAIMVCFISICIIYFPFNDSIAVAFMLYAFIGMGWAANDTFCTLFVFRLYPLTGDTMYFLGCIIVMISACASTLAINVCIALTNSYFHIFILFGAIGIVHSVLIIFLPTPQHDKLRTIKRSISFSKSANSQSLDENELNELARQVSMRLNENKNRKKYQNFNIALLMVLMILYSATERGSLSFITTYCANYLKINGSFGRYLMTSYFLGVCGFRVWRHLFFRYSNPVKQVVSGFITRAVLGIIFIFYGGENTIALIILYGMMGASVSACVPGILAWAESIRPITGIICCLWWVCYGIGDGLINISMGLLIDKYGARSIPLVIIVPATMAAIIVLIALKMYMYLKKRDAVVFDEIYNDNPTFT